jgi:predicted RNase H-like HicB family nuclease
VPELPDYAADGLTYKQALAHVEAIIGEWIDLAKELNGPYLNPKLI